VLAGAGAPDDRVALLCDDGPVSYGVLRAQCSRMARALQQEGFKTGCHVTVILPDGPLCVTAILGALLGGATLTLGNPRATLAELRALLAYVEPAVIITTHGLAKALHDGTRDKPIDRAQADQSTQSPTTKSARPQAPRAATPSSHLAKNAAEENAAEENAAEPIPSKAHKTESIGAASVFIPNGQRTPFDFAAWIAAQPADPWLAQTRVSDPALWLFTSGSTGAPKAAIHPHGNFLHHIEAYARGVLAMTSRDITLSVSRLHFAYATGMNLFFPLALGARAIVSEAPPTPQGLRALAAKHQPSILATVPTLTAKLLDDLEAAAAPQTESPKGHATADPRSDAAQTNAPQTHNLTAAPGDAWETARPPGTTRPPAASEWGCLRVVVSAGEALPPALFARWQAAVGVPMLDGIGAAELFHIYISNRIQTAEAGCHGALVDGFEAQICNESGTPLPDGTLGTLWVRGPTAARGYHKDPSNSVATFRHDGWVVTGDTFIRAADGRFFYQGRRDDLLKVGGIYVSPLEVEERLNRHPAVQASAVVGTPDANGLIKPVAFVETRRPSQTPSAADLQAHLRGHLAPYKLPRRFVFVAELPRNDRGKIVRKELRTRALATPEAES